MKKTTSYSGIFLTLFLLFLTGTETFSQTIDRGAYLQNGSQTSMVIRWRTTTNCNSRVRIGNSFNAAGTYATIVDDAASVTDHIVTITGLSPDTKYYYSVGTSAAVLQSASTNYFTTAPADNPGRKLRIAALGDCGAENATNQAAVYTAYQNFLTANVIDAPDALLLLGDNAYDFGTQTEFTNTFFTPYGGGTRNILRNHKLYPAPGNHDYNNSQTTANRILRSWPYFSVYSFPQNGECGGVASNKPNFYSYNIGNIHFLSLDSHGMESTDGNSYMGTASATTVMKNWIAADLAANSKKWVIAYWHHPPYTKGSHNSDSETQLVEIRTNFVTFLEQQGVDMIICGHSHSYERSMLIRNYTGNWASFSAATHAVSTSSARYTGTVASAPYKYNSLPLNHGTVYVVAGNAGTTTGSTTGFGGASSVMPYASTNPGFFYFEVDENRLDAKMINSSGATIDNFTMMKDVNKTTVHNIVIGQSVTLTASWPAAAGSFVWTNTSGTNRSATVTPATTGTFVYTVADNNNGGLLDNFTVNVTSTLPVTFREFTVRKSGSSAILNWSVSDISNHSYFSIERSVDGTRFSETARNTMPVQGANLQSFSFTDNSLPDAPVVYYRIRQCDRDGNCRYTDVKTVRLSSRQGLMVYPQPASHTLNIVFNAKQNTRISISLADESGQTVWREARSVQSGENTIPVDIARLKPGHYILTVSDGGVRQTEKVIKQ